MSISLALFSFLFSSSCAGTPQRAGANRSSPADIAVGLTQDQVQAVLGKPDRKYLRKSAAGELEVWAWVMRDPRAPVQRLGRRSVPTDVPAEWYYYFGVERNRAALKDGIIVAL